MRIGVFGDLHCGHINGIAPPSHQQSEDSQGCWKLLRKFCDTYGPFGAVFVMGDVIDGKASRNGGVELITTDQSRQADIAIMVLDSIPTTKRAKWFQVSGTPYHGGTSEDFERLVASSFGAEYGAVVWPEVDGCRFRLRHKINRAMNNLYKQMDTHVRRVGSGREKLADAILFGHLHVHNEASRSVQGRALHAISCPSLQGMTDFGGRQCDGDVDMGCLALDVHRGKITAVHKHVAPLGVDTWANAQGLGLI